MSYATFDTSTFYGSWLCRYQIIDPEREREGSGDHGGGRELKPLNIVPKRGLALVGAEWNSGPLSVVIDERTKTKTFVAIANLPSNLKAMHK